MRKETYEVRCPQRVIFGDPSYFEEFKGERLAGLVADYSPPPFSEARVVLEEKQMEDCPEFMERTMTLYTAPQRTIQTYMNGCMYKGQEQAVKEIGVDTACYMLEVDGRSDHIKTGGDGYWGDCQEFYFIHKGSRILDAVVTHISMPDYMDFDDMKQHAAYFFEGLQQTAGQEEKQEPQIKME